MTWRSNGCADPASGSGTTASNDCFVASQSGGAPNLLLLHAAAAAAEDGDNGQHGNVCGGVPIVLPQRTDDGGADHAHDNVVVEYVELDEILMEHDAAMAAEAAAEAAAAAAAAAEAEAVSADLSSGGYVSTSTSLTSEAPSVDCLLKLVSIPVQVVHPQPVSSPQKRGRQRRQNSGVNRPSSDLGPSLDDGLEPLKAKLELMRKDFEEYEPQHRKVSCSSTSSSSSSTSPQTSSSSQGGRRRVRVPIPDAKKDDKYWKRRLKNNMAAKRSRETKREKENQLTVKAEILEKQHALLMAEVEKARRQNAELRERLSKYEEV